MQRTLVSRLVLCCAAAALPLGVTACGCGDDCEPVSSAGKVYEDRYVNVPCKGCETVKYVYHKAPCPPEKVVRVHRVKQPCPPPRIVNVQLPAPPQKVKYVYLDEGSCKKPCAKPCKNPCD